VERGSAAGGAGRPHGGGEAPPHQEAVMGGRGLAIRQGRAAGTNRQSRITNHRNPSMGIKCGIVGLPNVGKSTLFNALTKAGIAAANFPFCTIEPNVGVVPVPDPRLNQLAAIINPQKVVPTAVEFVDIAGLVAGAASGEGLGNKFLAHIREVDAITHVVRCFEHGDIVHVAGKVDPISDIETIDTELALADLDSVEKALNRAERAAKGGDKEAAARKPVLLKLQAALAEGKAGRSAGLDDEEKALVRDLFLLTLKPVMYIANVL